MKSLIANLIADNYLTRQEIISAFRNIRREDFVPDEYKGMSYLDTPIPIGYGQTISQPATVAFMLELLNPEKGEKVLDVGSGSGWTTALLAELVGPEGRVYAMERILYLKNIGDENIDKYGFIKEKRVETFCQDGYKGLTEFAPFDKILVSAAAEEPPKKLLEQLKTNGRMVIPIGENGKLQDILTIDRVSDDEYKHALYPGFSFVPLIKG